jgi:hypothetical protein
MGEGWLARDPVLKRSSDSSTKRESAGTPIFAFNKIVPPSSERPAAAKPKP